MGYPEILVTSYHPFLCKIPCASFVQVSSRGTAFALCTLTVRVAISLSCSDKVLGLLKMSGLHGYEKKSYQRKTQDCLVFRTNQTPPSMYSETVPIRFGFSVLFFFQCRSK